MAGGQSPKPQRIHRGAGLPHDDDDDYDDDEDDDDEPGEYIGSGGVLMRCATVNKTWFYETTRILWRNWEERTLYGSVMTETFLKIEPDRRQCYANMIHRARDTSYW